jgi:CheY-like chemotaxis protein
VHEAHDGQEALRVIARTKPAFIFCDLQMPGMDGFELVRRLRADPKLCRIRVIAVSGLGSSNDFIRSSQAGFDGHLVKPITREIIAAQLERAFRGTLSPPPPPAHTSRPGELLPRSVALATSPEADRATEPPDPDADERAVGQEAPYVQAQTEDGGPTAGVSEPPPEGAAPGDKVLSLGAADEHPTGGAARDDSSREET